MSKNALTTAAGILSPTEVGARSPIAVFSSAGGVGDYTVEKKDDGTGFVRRLKIFKAGTFADSLGIRRTWTAEHLAQMVFNFELLKNGGVFTDVPVRADHRTSVMSLAGYFDAMSTDGSFLYGDIEFTEPEMFGKFERRTFRGRSLEVGFYEDNDETLYWPVVLGTAFVDIPAVEGLYGKTHILMSNDKETTAVEPTKFRVNGTEVTDAAAVQAHITNLETTLTQRPPAAAFRINGAETSDPQAVQTHIDTLETAATEQACAGRRDFVKGLVKANKLAAPQEQSVIDLVVGTKDLPGMNDAQFAAFKASYEAAPVIGLFQPHAGATNPGGETTEAQSALATAKAVVAQHRRAGMPEAQIKETDSYKLVAAVESQK